MAITSMNLTDPSNTPALAPPPGVTSNFVNPESLLTYVIVTIALCLTLTTVTIGLRIFTKVHIAKAMHWDDCESQRAIRDSWAIAELG